MYSITTHRYSNEPDPARYIRSPIDSLLALPVVVNGSGMKRSEVKSGCAK